MKNLIFILFCLLSITLLAGNNKVDKTKEVKAREWIKSQPLEFIENKGQFTDTDGKPVDNVLFKTSFGNCDIYITDKGLSYVFIKYEEDKEKGKGKKEKDFKPKFGKREKEENKKLSYYRLDMDLVGANIDKANVIKEEESKQGHYNYFYAHCPQGIYDVKGYGKITIKNIYKGIDWVIYTNANSKEHPLKYDFVVHSQADYKQIKIKFLNAQSTTLTDNDTKLKIQTIAGNIEEGNLYSYTTPLCHAERSEASHTKTQIETKNFGITSKYIITKDSIISFEIANYDTTKTLIIDPLVWATYYGGNSHDAFNSTCVDSLNNIYITGYTVSTDFPILQLTGAYYQSANSGVYNISILKFNNQGVRQWATYYGGNEMDIGYSICLDSQNNIYITGETDSYNFPIQQMVGAYFQPNHAWYDDIFLLKFNNQGIRQWATFYGGDSFDVSSSMCIDSFNNIFITGYTYSLNFPTQQLSGAYFQATNGGTPMTEPDVFILKFDNQGVRLWATYYGGWNYEGASSICTDSQDNIYVTGYTYSSNFPCQQLTGAYWQPTYSGGSAFILKFNNQGVRLWATLYGGSGFSNFSSIYLDNQNNIFITGIAGANVQTQQLSGAYLQSNNAGNSDVFILKFNNQGVRQWATYYGGSGNDFGKKICKDNIGNIYIVGNTNSTDFPIQQMMGEYWQANNTGINDAFILKLNDQGIRQWATYYGTSGDDYGKDLVVDHQNNVYFIGRLSGYGAYTIDYGNGAYYDNSYTGVDDSYILKIEYPCNNQKPTTLQSNRNNICISDNGSITLTAIGGMGDTLKWYSGSCGQNYIGKNTPLTIPSPTQTTTYYARWESICDTSACDSITIHVDSVLYTNQNHVICQGETFSVGVHIYSSTGIYRDTISTISGCDSIITTNLIVNPIKQTALNSVICQGEIFTVGTNIYTITGTYTDTLTTYLGCDSIVTTNLVVNPTKQTSINPVICQGEIFTVGIHNYITAGVYTDTLATYLGCDSIITTHLIVNPTKHTVLNPIICQGESYLVGTHTYITTGIYIDTLTTFLNCDSIVTTNLVVNPTKQTSINPVICQGEIFTVGIHNYITAGVYTDTLATYLGCDSIVTTNLIVNPTKHTILNPVICQGEIFTVGIHNYITAGVYTDTLTTFLGCDSIIITHLIVNPTKHTVLNPIICQGESYLVGTHAYTTTGIYIDTLTTFLNCDSIVTCNLIVGQNKQTTLNSSICQGESFAVGTHIYTTAGTFTDTLTTYLGCDSIITTNLTVNPIKQTSINPVICQGEKYRVGIHNYTVAGTYTDILTSYLGCDSAVTTNLTVKPSPIVNLGSDGEICDGDTIELSVNLGYTTYLWQDESTNNSFVVSQAGTYWLTVNYNDCIQSDTVRYYVCANDIKIWVPNSFTPNGDGLNDIFAIKTIAEFSEFRMLIYNRWGQLIFESKDAKIGWDGKFNGELVPLGLYTYNIEYTAKENKQAKRFSGKVTVLR